MTKLLHAPILAGLLFGVLFAVSLSALAQETRQGVIRFVPKKDSAGRLSDNAHISVTGPIGLGSPQALALALEQAKRKPSMWTASGDAMIPVFLNSPGGNVGAAVAMGRLLRAYAAEVYVDSDHRCASACILVLAGGVTRTAFTGGQLYIHRPFFDASMFAGLSFDASQRKYAALTSGVQKYLSEMGLADDLFHSMMRVPSNDSQMLEHEYAERVSLLGNDPAYDEWIRARASQRHGLEFVRRLDEYMRCVNLVDEESRCRARLGLQISPQ